jgi:hypothetical protein
MSFYSKLLDATGRLLFSLSFNGLSNEVPVDTTKLAAGAYMVRISDANGKTKNIELIIQR